MRGGASSGSGCIGCCHAALSMLAAGLGCCSLLCPSLQLSPLGHYKEQQPTRHNKCCCGRPAVGICFQPHPLRGAPALHLRRCCAAPSSCVHSTLCCTCPCCAAPSSFVHSRCVALFQDSLLYCMYCLFCTDLWVSAYGMVQWCA